MSVSSESKDNIIDHETELTLGDLCRACNLSAEQVFMLIEEGVIEPIKRHTTGWRFQTTCITRARCASRLERDLGVNLAGAALAIDLLGEIDQLRSRLRQAEGQRL